MRRHLVAMAGAAVVLGMVGAPAASAHGGDDRRTEVIEVDDDCDPQTFNEAIGPGTCVGEGDTTFADFLEQLAEDGEANHWDFHPEETTIRHGDRLVAKGIGGEFHTFTEVAEFGGGCIEELNVILGLEPVAECSDLVTLPDGQQIPRGFVEDGVPPAGRLAVEGLGRGTHRFECLIHPWMRSTITVRERR